MLEETLYSEGRNQFRDYTFDQDEWSAPTYVSPEEIRSAIKACRLEGRTIRRFNLVGRSDYHKRDKLEENCYCTLERSGENLSREEMLSRADYDHIDPDTVYKRCALIEEPLLIQFEDNDVFEILVPQEPEFRFSMNSYLWWLHAERNPRNVDADVLFAPCIGKRIERVEINTELTDRDPMLNEYFDERHSMRELARDITLRFEDGTGLRINGWYDSCVVSLVLPDGEDMCMKFSELKGALMNEEDLHVDPLSGYWAESPNVYLGREGIRKGEEACLEFEPEGVETRLGIPEEVFRLWDWSISIVLGEEFDYYDNYLFSAAQWNAILAEAERLMSFATFDDLFDYMKKIESPNSHETYLVSLAFTNHYGKDFWRARDDYQKQLRDVRAWSRLVMPESGWMNVYGN